MNIEQVLAIIDRPTAWAWIRQQHLPSGVICPSCSTLVVGHRALASFNAMDRTYCKSCGSTFQAKAAVAFLRGTEWQPEEYVKLRLLQLAAVHPAAIAKWIGKSITCVRGMLDRIEILESLPSNEGHILPSGSEPKG